MAKSLRSKTKREFRSKKRTSTGSVYAAAEAARLHRLNTKLLAVVSKDADGDEVLKEDAPEGMDTPGSCWFAAFGLLDPDDITADSMGYFSEALHRAGAPCSQSRLHL
ncbi:hypothetical protein GYMLUDRAFT_56187 [Collybiopsis luxurians FD-317 M1]|nr:hypothetical protein GYMLUDRAFT_56187 [Collybiopsis luxurians FD-317 M1]